MTTESRDQREGQPEPKSAGIPGGGAVLGATPCSACGCGWREFVEELADRLKLPKGATRKYVGSGVSNKIDDLIRDSFELALARQDIATIREIITNGGTAADVLKFLYTPNA